MNVRTISLIILSVFISSCNDMLDKYPLDTVTETSFWKSEKDLELYVNKFYKCFPDHRKNQYGGGTYTDTNSDNKFLANSTWLNCSRTLPTSASSSIWSWTAIRDINYFFENYYKVPSGTENAKQYIGEMHFFKAWYYFDLLKKYGDLPWYNKVLQMDSEELYDPRISRSIIADSICLNLDKSISLLGEREDVPQDRFSKDLALAFKARVCLYEGTWEKYHYGTCFGVEGKDGTPFLRQALEAATELMSKGHELYTYEDGTDYVNNYLMLFNRDDYSNVKEVLFWKKYSKDLGYTHSVEYHGWDSYITSSLVNQFLCTNGKPIFYDGQNNPEYKGDKTIKEMLENRDPRLGALIFTEDEPKLFDLSTGKIMMSNFIKLKGDMSTPTGLNRKKGCSFDYAQYANDAGTIGAITMRYAEVLLIYAEAKAELGELQQSDLDKSINLLRKRVGMPDLKMEISYSDPNWEFPALSPIINEIRRERRVELAFEGLRNDDICRWAAADELIVGKRPKGFYFNKDLYPDIEPGKDIYLDENGYLDPLQKQIPSGYGFNVERDYLDPLPTEELLLNENLVQNPGWEQ